jgi:5'-nucleotidase
MAILISNDDGIQNPAIWALIETLRPLGEIVVVAPDRNRSGVGTALTLNEPIRISRWPSDAPGVEAWVVEGGTPGDSVIAGLVQVAPGRIDAVVTGFNPGNNVSADVMVSGTVGAALQAYLNGFRAMATSVALAEDANDECVRDMTRAAVGAMLNGIEGAALFNLNFPRLADYGTVRGVRRTTTAPRLVSDHLEPTTDEQGRDAFWVSRRAAVHVESQDLPEDCDIRALREGYASLTSLGWSLRANGTDAQADKIVSAAAGVLNAGEPRIAP